MISIIALYWDRYWAWFGTHPIIGTIVTAYLVVLIFSILSMKGRSGAADDGSSAVGGWLAVGAVGLVVLAVLRWSAQTLFGV